MADNSNCFNPAWPPPYEEVRRNVERALRDGSWGRYHGPWNERLVEALCEYHGTSFARLCCSGTVAVELALRGLQIGPGDEVILGAYDFPGNFRCVEHVGAHPVVVDIHSTTGCLDPELLDSAIGDKTRAIIVSHLHGGVADMPAICAVAKSRGIQVVEDICQAPGAIVGSKLAGSWGDISAISFGGSKLTTAGRGGAILSNDETVMQRIRIFCERGNDAFPLSELQAAAVLPQWSCLNSQNQIRQANAIALAARLERLEWIGQLDDPDNLPSYYKVGLRLGVDVNRADWIGRCKAAGLPVDEGFRGFIRRSARRCRAVGSLENASAAATRGIVLHHPVLLQDRHVIDALADRLNSITRD